MYMLNILKTATSLLSGVVEVEYRVRDCSFDLSHPLSKEAWQVVWELLNQGKPVEVQYVAANTLYFKITRCLADIPPAEVPALKDKIVNVLAQYVQGPALVTTRLGLTMASFIANTIGLYWKDPLEELGTVFQPQNFPGVPELKILKILIQIFGYVPEQIQTQWQHATRRNAAYQALQAKGENMFSWLFNILRSQPDPDTIVEILKALNSWMKVSCVCSWSEVLTVIDTLVSYCATAAASDEDAVCESCLEILSGIIADPSATMYPSLMLNVLGRILPLQASIDLVLMRNNMELASSFYSMYVAMADCHSRLCVEVVDPENRYAKENPQNRANVQQLVGIILRCTGTPGSYPVEEIMSSITISVWYSIMEEIQSKQSNEAMYVRLMLFFDDVYKSLAEILVRKAQYPLENFDSWNSEEKEQFRVYRQDVGDCLTYCFELRGWSMLNELVAWAERQVDSIENDPTQIEKVWPEIESILNAIRAVTENVNDDPTDVLMVDSMTRGFNVIFRVLKFNRERKIPKIFQAAIECLFQPEIATSSALALKTLSRDCSSNLLEFIPQIIASCKQALCSGMLSENDCMRLVYCVGRFVVYLPLDQILSIVDEIFAPGLTQLQSIAVVEPQATMKPQLVSILNMFSTLCYALDPCMNGDEDDDEDTSEETAMSDNNSSGDNKLSKKKPTVVSEPLIPIVEKILPTLITVAKKWARDETVMESLLGIVKHTLASLHLSSTPVLDYSIQLVLISFEFNPLTVTCSLAKQTILMIGKENLGMQCRFLAQIHSLSIDRLKNARDNLEFAESYFIMLAQFIKNDLNLVKESQIPIEPMLDLAIDTLAYSEAPMLKAGIYFVTVCVEKADENNPGLSQYLKLHGPRITHKIVISVGCIVPRSSIHHFAELYVALNRNMPAEWRKWLTDVLGLEGFPSAHLDPEVKNKFFMKVTRGQANKRGVQEALNEFTLACRNLSGSEYAAMTSKRF
ncbi:unnamed protein product [Allacma fusca]|uniref:Exportin-1/Importin-beta-like domain-containing protein n=1 Tax=Allacma fusca TaxID=39272 RepID=A0A8J2KXZ5_9HEXA|nr:unnamed protein product [Allacma fusca]